MNAHSRNVEEDLYLKISLVTILTGGIQKKKKKYQLLVLKYQQKAHQALEIKSLGRPK